MEIEELIKNLNFANISWQILTPIIFSGCDFLTGFIQAVINKNVDSSVMRVGLLHKFLIIVIILLAFVADISFNINYISKFIGIYVIIMETYSIIENIKKAGIDLTKLTVFLKMKGGKSDEIK